MPRRRRARARRPDPLGSTDPGADSRWTAEFGEFDPAEFAEFLDADDSPVPVDPAFRERLRQQLWGLVRERSGRDPSPPQTPGKDPKRPR
ncbi:MAG: hypothetical protein DCC71_04830 [Proteobacteria bacterium]|nr:MAG: hypothetical protein DCC71_04830 [Pseudomonadota bacterium]